MPASKKTSFPWALWSRRLHRWSTVVVAVPLLVILATGVLLLWKKDVAWIQPPTQKGVSKQPSVSFDEILAVAGTVEQASIAGWEDIDRLDVRPTKGVVKVRAKSGYEVQVDLETSEVLQVAYRRSDIIESIHDGSFFHDAAKLWLFFPVSLVALGLYGTGLYLFYLPIRARQIKKRKQRAIGEKQAEQEQLTIAQN